MERTPKPEPTFSTLKPAKAKIDVENMNVKGMSEATEANIDVIAARTTETAFHSGAILTEIRTGNKHLDSLIQSWNDYAKKATAPAPERSPLVVADHKEVVAELRALASVLTSPVREGPATVAPMEPQNRWPLFVALAFSLAANSAFVIWWASKLAGH